MRDDRTVSYEPSSPSKWRDTTAASYAAISTCYHAPITTRYEPRSDPPKDATNLHDYAWFEAQAEKAEKRASRRAIALIGLVVALIVAVRWWVYGSLM